MAKKKELSLQEKLDNALVPNWEQPYAIPKNWVWVRLQSVCTETITDGTHQTPKYSTETEGMPFVSAKDITKTYIDWSKIKYITTDLHQELYKRVAPKVGDVLLAKNGTTGVAAIVETEKEFSIYVTIALLRPNLKNVLPYFLYRLINSPVAKEQFDQNLTGIGVPNLHLRDVRDTKIPIPPLQEQKRIVKRIESLFAKLDKAKELLENALESFDTRKSALLHQAFTGELTKKWREENGVSFESWEEKPFEDFCYLNRGFDLPAKNRTSGKYSLVTSSGETDTHNEYKVKAPGVVTGRSGTIGKVFYVEKDYWPLNTTLYSKKVYDNEVRFIYYYLMNFDFKKYSSSTAVPTLNRNNFSSETVVVPTLLEQKEIVRILDSILQKEEEAKIKAQNSLEHIAHMKKAILARAFRGELGTNDENEESALELLKEVLE